jgi:hypothetical protein
MLSNPQDLPYFISSAQNLTKQIIFTVILSSNDIVTMTNPDLDLLGTYLYMFLAYHPLHLLTKTLTLSWLVLLACVLRMLSYFACTFVLHVMFFLHVCMPYTCLFSYMRVYLTRVGFPSSCLFLICFLFSKISIYPKNGPLPTCPQH